MEIALKTTRDELNNYEYLYDGILDESIKRRAKVSLEYYIGEANKYKFWWRVLTVFSVILPAFATFFSVVAVQCAKIGWIVALITSLTTITTGLLNAFKIVDKKSTYRDLAERLKSVLTTYQYDIKGLDDNKRNELTNNLAMDIESVIAEEKVKICQIEKKQEV